MSRAAARARASLGVALAASILASCAGGGTSILVEVVSDLEVPGEVDTLRIEVTGAESSGMLDEERAIGSPFPHTYRIHPRAGHESEAITITVTARLGASLRVRRVVGTAFQSGQHIVVTIPLPRECLGVECAPGVDCMLGRCEGAADGGVDGGAPDAPGDGGCVDDCDDGIECTDDVCSAGACERVPDDGRCAAGELCHLTDGCGARCAGDGDCDDALFCNGAELCMDGRCMRGSPPDCADTIACTTDSCDEAGRACRHDPDHALCDDGEACDGIEMCDPASGCVEDAPLDCDDASDCSTDGCADDLCTHQTRDADGDGHGDLSCPELGGVAADDCDDADRAVLPGAPELCNGDDDDCDGTADESFGCPAGTTGSCTTGCGTTGSRTCSAACAWSVCAAPAEVCNGVDDDCNGAADDGFTCIAGSSAACTTTCGTTGVRSCDGSCALGACEPPAEVCEDGTDQDCDGVDPLCRDCPGGTDAECDDGDVCNGAETCFRDTCAPGVPLVCDDMIRCTLDACDPATGCRATPDDRLCADTSFCNGDERCDPSVGGCRPAASPPTCDDASACTDDACVGASPGMCVQTTRDADRDGHGDRACSAAGGVPADDCDDAVATTFAGAPELCNGADDDCDAACDDGFACCRGSSGSCATSCGTTGSRVCSTVCSWGVCSPPPEVCNGVDDDCNSACDDGFACCAGSSGSCTTSCGSTGSRTCGADCGWSACAPPAEACNGRDDDCDGTSDDGFTCAAGATGSCTTACGTSGTRTCAADCTWGACTAPAEACNAIDDDCDGRTDEDFGCPQGTTGSCMASCGTTGSRTCSAACSWSACTAPAEICNGADDDCDTFADDGFPCVRGATGSCTASCGSTGSRTCSASCAWSACAPPVESCNGADDDCDSTCDDGFGCCRGTTGTCTTSCGTTGSRLCGAGCTYGSCVPPAEVCNGVDDDCALGCDDTFACCRGASGTCTTSCGTTGSRTCGASCAWGACAPPAEICNGTDDDCDAIADDGFACAAGATRSCTASCGSTGTQTCAAGTCTWGACVAPSELCNGLDDDCDTRVDETSTCTPGATGGCTTSCGSTGSRTCSALCAWGTCNAPAEICNGADDDCDAMIDDGFTCPAGGTGACTASCGTTGSRTCSAACSWGACSPPAEVCNGTDDDCDAMIDDGFTCAAGSSGTCTTSCGSTGSHTCSASCMWGACGPPAETCNGLDDDCDTLIDDGFTCASGSMSSCVSSCGTTGSRTCSGTCAWSACTPPVEVCNGADDDCDAACDDGFACCRGATGACTTSCGSTGSRTCSATCGWGACAAPAEVCNGVDDDCDSIADDGFVCRQGATGACTTSCGSAGSRTCGAGCTWGACLPPTEICNGADDDCDGASDNGFACVSGASGACTTSCGSTGTRTCAAGTCTWGACTAPAEICNGLDDDCDSIVDETFTCRQGSTGACTASCGTTGSRTCSSSCTWGVCTPPAEVCNGADDDCDVACDNGFACCQSSTGACTTSCGSTGSRMCSTSCAWGACTPPAEVCNGADDDCDALCDDGFACCRGATGSCTTGCGSTGSRSCSTSCSWGSCNPPAESCNGVDDDCDSVCDNGFTCCGGTSGACTTSCGSTGSRTCSGATCTWGACAPPAEICNGADDDCDALCDDGFACCQGSTRSCTTSCGSTGSEACNATCTGYGACTPPVETCTNGVDDDCDTLVDCLDTAACSTNPACIGCAACTGATTVTPPGGRYTVALGPGTHTGTCGGAGGSEAYLTFTVVVPSDVFISTHGTSVDTVVYVRNCTCAGSEVAGGCNHDADGLMSSRLQLTGLAAGTYNVFVDSTVAMSASVAVDLYVTPTGTASDRCGNPTFLPAGTASLAGTTCGFTHDVEAAAPVTGCSYPDSGDTTEDRIFAVYLPTARTVTFNGCASGNYDSVLYARTICTDGTAGAQPICNDDGCSGGSGCTAPRYRPNLTATLGPGLFYFVVDGFPYGPPCQCGNYSFAITGL